MINNQKTQALQYVKNTNGGATWDDFIEDHSPIGRLLKEDLQGLIEADAKGRIWLTESGDESLKAGSLP